MAEVLSQQEIDALLTAINAGEGVKPLGTSSEKMPKIYDFKRHDQLSKEQICFLKILHETVVREWMATTFQYLQLQTQMHIASIIQLTYEEYFRAIPNPTSIIISSGTYNSVRLPGNIIIEVDSSTSNALLYSLFDGIDNCDRNKIQHELTPIEKSAMEYFSKILINKYSEIWNGYCGVTIDSRNNTIETNKAFVYVAHSREMAVLITIDTLIDDNESMINICLPYPFLKSLLPFFSKEYFDNRIFSSSKSFEETFPKKPAEDLPITVRIELFQMIVLYKDLINYGKGSVLYAAWPYKDKYCNLMVDRIVLFHGEIITDNTNALNPHQVKITNILKPYKEFDIMENREINEMEKNLANMKVQVVVELGCTVKTFKELREAGEGTIIELDKIYSDPIDIFANNILFAKGEVVVIDENFGIRINEIIGEEQAEKEIHVEKDKSGEDAEFVIM